MPTYDIRTKQWYTQRAVNRNIGYWLGSQNSDSGWVTSINNSQLQDLGDDLTSRKVTQSNPNWKIKVSKNQDASTPYHRREIEFVPGRSVVKTQIYTDGYPGSTRSYGEDSVTWPTRFSALNVSYEDSALSDLAVTRLKRKLGNRTQSFNSIIPLAELRELRQTVDGMANTTMKTLIALSDVKRTLKRSVRNIKDPAKLRKSLKSAYKDASNIWLTYSFGVSPMMSTILDVNKSIGSYLTRYDSIDRLTGSATREWNVPMRRTDQAVASCNGAVLESYSWERHKLQYKYIAGHKFTLTSANDYSAADHFGIRPPSLIPALWELTAFSWVVDYFTTVGAFLDDTFTGTTGNSIYVVKNRKYTIEGETRPIHKKAFTDPYYKYERFDTSNSAGFFRIFDFRREVLSAYPPRVLRFRTLDEIGLNGVSKLLNLTSVLSKSF